MLPSSKSTPKHPSEEMESKVGALWKTIELASDSLKNEDYVNAHFIYKTIVNEFLDDDISLHENINVSEIHLCSIYADIGSGLDEMAMFMLHTFDIKYERLPLIPYLKAHLYIREENIPAASMAINICYQLIRQGCLFEPNKILNEAIIPELNIQVMKVKLKTLQYACKYLERNADNERAKENFKETHLRLGKISEFDYRFSGEESASAESEELIELKETIDPMFERVVRTATVATQTAPVKSCHVSLQTAGKLDTVVNNKELFAAVLDIRTRLNNLKIGNQNDVKACQKRNEELVKMLAMKEAAVTAKTSELNTLKAQHEKTKKELEAMKRRFTNTEKMLVDAVNHKFLMQKNFYNTLEQMYGEKLNYFRSLQESLTYNDYLLSRDLCANELKELNEVCNRFKNSKASLETYHRNLHKKMKDGSYDQVYLLDWPLVPPLGRFVDVVHEKFKSTAIESSRAQFTRPPYSRPRGVLGGNAWSSTLPAQSNNLSSPCDSARFQGGADNQASNDYQLQQELLNFLCRNCPGVSESELLEEICHIQTLKNCSVLALPKKMVLSLIRKRITDKHEGIGIGYLPAVSSENLTVTSDEDIDSRPICCICVEVYNPDQSFQLSCKHEFHKKCIVGWFKVKKQCPVCRADASAAAEFPPL